MEENNIDNIMLALCQASEEMRTHAINGEWKQVAIMDIKRRDLFEELVHIDTPGLLKQTRQVQKILSIDQEVIRLASKARDTSLAEQLNLSNKNKSCGTYMQIEGHRT